ncbi:peptidoglycan-recognition protein LF-like [Lycorma delicatula]|uniref:peptidoglycan-recognition protein LF-like n=1 Tax=Lycorma delicatula TaxID=130591 RepID=UPI003F5131AB
MANGMPESSVSTDSSVEPKRSINDGNNYSLETLENPFKKNPEDYSIRQNSFDQNFPVSLNTDSSDDYNNILGGIYGPINVDNAVDVTIGGKMSVTGDITVNQIIYPNGTITQDSTNSNWSDVLSSCKSGDISYPNGITSQPVLHVTTTKPLGKGWMREWWTWMSCAVGGALLVLVTVVVISLTLPKNSANKKTLQPQYPFVIPDNVTVDGINLKKSLHIVQRDQWNAEPPNDLELFLEQPVPLVIIQHTVTNPCDTLNYCNSLVLSMQNYHMHQRKYPFSDIAYNFLIGGNGYIYVGRSWEYTGTHTIGYNGCSIGIAMIGNFTSDSRYTPTEEQFTALKYLIVAGVKLGRLSENYKLYASRILNGSKSPGEKVINVIKKWPHYSTDSVDKELCNQILDDNDKVLLSDGLHIIQRIDWMAHPPDGELAQMVHPIPYISIQHTETPSCFSIVKCGSRVLNIQEDHMENRNFNDIGYNFLIGGDGYVYVGRSWEYVGAHTYPYNYCSLGIGLIGDFSKNEPSENQMKALKYLIEAGVESEKLSKDYRLYSANTLKSTNSPGENVIKIIKNWPHWSTEQIKSKCFIQKKN